MKDFGRLKRLTKRAAINVHNSLYPTHADRINVILWRGSKGMLNSGSIVEKTLCDAGFKVRQVGARLAGPQTALPLLKSKVNIFMQYVYPEFLPYAKHNVLIPNPEWGEHEASFIRNNFDCVLAKTRDCERIYRQELDQVEYISFTSNDIRDEAEKQKKYIHFGGKSPLKGTDAVIALWNSQPDLPPLHLFSYEKDFKEVIKSPNIIYRYEKLADHDIRRLQNEALFHICPSEYEGFGHQLNEAKSAGSVVFTTDAAPMNELVRPDFGYLIRARFKGTMQRAMLYDVEESAFLESILESAEMSHSEIDERCERARDSYEKNDVFFKRRLVDIISSLFH